MKTLGALVHHARAGEDQDSPLTGGMIEGEPRGLRTDSEGKPRLLEQASSHQALAFAENPVTGHIYTSQIEQRH